MANFAPSLGVQLAQRCMQIMATKMPPLVAHDAAVMADAFIRAHHGQRLVNDQQAFSGTTHDVAKAMLMLSPSTDSMTLAKAMVSTIRDFGTPLNVPGFTEYGHKLHCDLVVEAGNYAASDECFELEEGAPAIALRVTPPKCGSSKYVVARKPLILDADGLFEPVSQSRGGGAIDVQGSSHPLAGDNRDGGGSWLPRAAERWGFNRGVPHQVCRTCGHGT